MFLLDGYITITDRTRYVKAPFTTGEMALSAIKRVAKLPSPCQGNGTCGMCIIEVLRADGSLKRELACKYPAREMTVVVRLVRPANDAVPVYSCEDRKLEAWKYEKNTNR